MSFKLNPKPFSGAYLGPKRIGAGAAKRKGYKMKLYCLYDIFAGKISLIFEQPNDYCAKRYLTPIFLQNHHDLDTFRLDCLAEVDLEKPAVKPAYREICKLSDVGVLELPHE